MAEFIGAALILIFGAGAGCSVVLSGNPAISSTTRGVSTYATICDFASFTDASVVLGLAFSQHWMGCRYVLALAFSLSSHLKSVLQALQLASGLAVVSLAVI